MDRTICRTPGRRALSAVFFFSSWWEEAIYVLPAFWLPFFPRLLRRFFLYFYLQFPDFVVPRTARNYCLAPSRSRRVGGAGEWRGSALPITRSAAVGLTARGRGTAGASRGTRRCSGHGAPHPSPCSRLGYIILFFGGGGVGEGKKHLLLQRTHGRLCLLHIYTYIYVRVWIYMYI